jgi:archaellum component FlaC
MPYQKITLRVVVNEDDSEFLIQALNDVMDKIEDQMTVYSSEIATAATGEPENAEEITAPIE